MGHHLASMVVDYICDLKLRQYLKKLSRKLWKLISAVTSTKISKQVIPLMVFPSSETRSVDVGALFMAKSTPFIPFLGPSFDAHRLGRRESLRLHS